MLSITELHPTDAALQEADRCRREAQTTVAGDPQRATKLKGQPSGWCVVTQKGIWSRVYHNLYGEERLRQCLDEGHKVLLTLGIVAQPDSPLKPESHVAVIRVADMGRLSDYKLDLITARAKLHAARALIK